MYRPTKIVLENFGSHRETVYEYPKNETTLVTGLNATDEGQGSNGSGKSFLLEAFAFCLLGSSFRKVKDAELIYYGEKSAFISLELHSEVLNETLRIERILYSNTKSSELSVFINDEEKKDIVSVLEGNKYILDKVGLSRDDLLNYFLISKEKYTSFFSSSDTAKKELINRFSKAYIVDSIDDEIKQDITHKENEVESIERQIISIQGKIDAYEEQKEVDEDNSKRIADLEGEQLSLRNSIQSDQERLEENKKREAEFSAELEERVDVRREAEEEINEIEEVISEYQKVLDEAERNIKAEVTCPKCDHNFSIKDEEADMDDQRALQKECTEGIKQLLFSKMELNEVLSTVDELDNETKSNISRVSSENRTIKYNIKSMNDSLAYIDGQIEKLNQKSDNSSKEEALKKYRKQQKELDKNMKEAKKELASHNEWQINFKRFKGYLANKSLRAIETYTNYYLDQLESSITIKIEGYKENSNKKIVEKINTMIYRNGVDNGSFYKLSGGEKARVEVAIILAMVKLMNMSADGKGLDFIEMDEILDSIDGDGLEILIRKLDLININMLLVSHGNIQLNVKNQMLIEKTGGVSRIVNN